ncbi:POMT1, partial [Cordylochernes scorpioides]
DICLLYKPSQDLEADIFTKDLSRDQMKKHLENLSIRAKLEAALQKIQLSSEEAPWRLKVELNVATLVLLGAALATRLWNLEHPRAIVFDELHYGKFVAFYMKRTFFFDAYPPLGKMLVALAGYVAGYDGETDFDKIGGAYGNNVPIRALRFIPALFGSFLVPVVYHLVLELGMSHRTALLAGLLVILEEKMFLGCGLKCKVVCTDNALLTQSRYILMESMLIFFSLLGILAILRFRRLLHRQSCVSRPFSGPWWLWLLVAGVSLACSLSIKYSGVFSLLLCLLLLAWDLWQHLLPNHSLSDGQVVKMSAAILGCLLIIPVVVYLGFFYVHLSILTKAGPHDTVMTSAFQASLEGGLASITKGQPLQVAHGSQITLRHSLGRPCWLHSHENVYPIKYPDGRGSSHQQQVTCYTFKDVNNWWIVKRPDKNDLMVSEPIDTVKHGDVIQLIHGMTSRALNSHDVAAPMSPQHQEVSCYIDYNINFTAQNQWKVDIVNRETEGDVWHTIHSQVRLVHLTTGQALKFSGKQLPDWGFHQHEVVTDKILNQDDTLWNVEEHRYTKSEDQKERERELGMAEFVPLQPTRLSFWEKFWELQVKMLSVNQEVVQDHVYTSDPFEWLLMTRGIAYWVSPDSNAQIHLLGNVVVWYSATLGLGIYLGLLALYLLRRQRGVYDISERKSIPNYVKFSRLSRRM